MSVFLRRYRNDMLLIAALLLLCGLIFAVRTCRTDKGKYAVVEIGQEIVDVFLLSENTEKDYMDGETFLNRIHIENEVVSVSEASCPDQICVHHKPVSKAGETIVCLPHRFVITITDQAPQAPESPDNSEEQDSLGKPESLEKLDSLEKADSLRKPDDLKQPDDPEDRAAMKGHAAMKEARP